MTNVKGMTIKQFNDTIKDMRKVYSFDDDNTRIISLDDIFTHTPRRIEIATKDKNTGIDIVLSKGIDITEKEYG